MKTWQKLPIGGKEKRLQMFFKKIKTWERFSGQKIYKQKRKNDSLGGGLLLFLSRIQARSSEARKYVSTKKMREAKGGKSHINIISPPFFP